MLNSPSLWFVSLALILALMPGCRKPKSTESSESSALNYPACRSAASDPDGDGWGWENNRSCRVTNTTARPNQTPASPFGGFFRWPFPVSFPWPGWGTQPGTTPAPKPAPTGAPSPQQGGSSGYLSFNSTYYPYGNEGYYQTTCGSGNDYGGIFFAVTERSPLWSGSCDNNSWALCDYADCLGKWDRMPNDVKRIENGRRMVREPRCNVACGQKFRVANMDRSVVTTAVIYDACPSQHWNNRFKEVTEGRNPCAAGSRHVDLRKPLYLKLTQGRESGNIDVLIDPKPIP